MTKAPSIKEALDLKPCPFCGGEPDIRTRQDEDIWTHNTVTWTGVHCAECGISFDWPPGAEPDAKAQWNTRATLSPPAGERREAIARIIAGPLCDATKGEHSIAVHGNYQFCTQCGETISKRWHGIVDARNKADALIASGLVQNEAGWRTIETAPKNHFPVLTWSEQGGRCVAFLDATWTWWPCPATEPLSNKPTHWMPLPAPPIRSARDGGAES